jgi:hypothetical protein
MANNQLFEDFLGKFSYGQELFAKIDIGSKMRRGEVEITHICKGNP